MRRDGIRAIMARPRRACTTDSHHDFPIAANLLKRNFIAAAPNRICLPTSPMSRPIRLYLATVMDVYSLGDGRSFARRSAIGGFSDGHFDTAA
jgi:putative transposase